MQSTADRDTRSPTSSEADFVEANVVERTVLPVIQEELVVGKRVVETGGVHVRTRLTEHKVAVDLPMRHDEVVVERVPVNRPVDMPVEVRQEGDVTIIPVHEEVTVVTRQLVLKEELHVRKITRESTETRQVTLRRQDVDVERLPANTASAGVADVMPPPEPPPRA